MVECPDVYEPNGILKGLSLSVKNGPEHEEDQWYATDSIRRYCIIGNNRKARDETPCLRHALTVIKKKRTVSRERILLSPVNLSCPFSIIFFLRTKKRLFLCLTSVTALTAGHRQKIIFQTCFYVADDVIKGQR